MTTITKTPPPIRFADLPESWIGTVANAALRDDVTIRGFGDRWIEVETDKPGIYLTLLLPSGTYEFASTEDRNAALRAIALKSNELSTP